METDGSADGNPKHHRVRAHYIVFGRVLNIPELVALVNAPDNSWIKTHELVMSDLSYALCGSIIERKPGSEQFEKLIKSCNRSITNVRKKFENNAQNAVQFKECMKPAIEAVNECYSKLQLHDEPHMILDDQDDLVYETFRAELEKINPKLIDEKNDWTAKYIKTCDKYQSYLAQNVDSSNPYRVIFCHEESPTGIK